MIGSGAPPGRWSRRHLLDVADLSLEETELLLRRAETATEQLASSPATGGEGSGPNVALLFAEPSTRTRLSFEIAARRIGGQVLVFDPGASSLLKGESIPDTARTLDALGVEMLVMRHPRSGAPYLAAEHFAGHVINAGDGWHAHPTQALIDLFTLRRSLGEGGLRGRKVVIVGDVLHSRVCRSNVWTLTAGGADVWLCGPQPFLHGFAEWATVLPADRRLTVTDDMTAALRDADAVMALRVQRERIADGFAGSIGEYVTRYQLTEQKMAAYARADAVFLHPGPVNEGVEVSADLVRGRRSLVLEQVRNGVPVRMAVLGLLAAGDARG